MLEPEEPDPVEGGGPQEAPPWDAPQGKPSPREAPSSSPGPRTEAEDGPHPLRPRQRAFGSVLLLALGVVALLAGVAAIVLATLPT